MNICVHAISPNGAGKMAHYVENPMSEETPRIVVTVPEVRCYAPGRLPPYTAYIFFSTLRCRTAPSKQTRFTMKFAREQTGARSSGKVRSVQRGGFTKRELAYAACPRPAHRMCVNVASSAAEENCHTIPANRPLQMPCHRDDVIFTAMHSTASPVLLDRFFSEQRISDCPYHEGSNSPVLNDAARQPAFIQRRITPKRAAAKTRRSSIRHAVLHAFGGRVGILIWQRQCWFSARVRHRFDTSSPRRGSSRLSAPPSRRI